MVLAASLQPFDLLPITLLVIGIPLWGNLVAGPALRRRILAGTLQRIPFYVRGMLLLWACAAVLVLDWIFTRRAPGDLGLVLSVGSGLFTSLILFGVIVGLVIGQGVKLLKGGADKGQRLADKNPLLFGMLPSNRRELRYFVFLSITAGITEELLYRGFLIHAFGAYMQLWVAAALSSVFFGLGHGYQGMVGVVKTFIVGLVMAALYLWSGTLLLPIVLHACLDIQAGVVGLRVNSRKTERLGGDGRQTSIS